MPTIKELLGRGPALSSGHRMCAGCTAPIIVKMISLASKYPLVVSCATGCLEVATTIYPYTAWNCSFIHNAFENSAATISGVETAYRALRKKGKIKDEIKFIGFGGDGGSYDIGLQSISGAMERGHDILYVCYDNEAYMNTGIQRSSSTPFGAATTTSPAGKVKPGQMTWKKNMPAIAAAHNIPYVATACPSYPIDLVQKVKKAARIEGPAYIHILSVCPTGWRSAPENSVKLGRLAVETGVFPLFEVEDGRYRLNIDFPQLRPLKEYTRLQGRFRHLSDERLQEIEKRVHQEYEQLREKAGKRS